MSIEETKKKLKGIYFIENIDNIDAKYLLPNKVFEDLKQRDIKKLDDNDRVSISGADLKHLYELTIY